MRRLNLSGKKFNSLTAIRFYKCRNKESYWLFQCDCGKRIVKSAPKVKSGWTKSCGHLKTTRNSFSTKNVKFYDVWRGMNSRCYKTNNISYPNYGKRGIKVQWKTFEDFVKDMFESYLRHYKKFGSNNTLLDRIDYDGDYCKENCRWVTWKQQMRNTRRNFILTLNNKTQTMAEWEEKTGIESYNIWQRIKILNWSIEKALTTPVKR